MFQNNLQGNRMGWGFVAFGFGMSFGAIITSALGAPDHGVSVFGHTFWVPDCV